VIHGTHKNLLAALLVLASPSTAIALLLPVSVLLVKARLRFLLLALVPVAIVIVVDLLAWLCALPIGLWSGGGLAFAATAASAALSRILR
jgi:hypothetical protein